VSPSSWLQTMARTTPPSTRKAAPVVADARGLHTKTIRLATSSTVANRLSREVGRAVWKNSASARARQSSKAATRCVAIPFLGSPSRRGLATRAAPPLRQRRRRGYDSRKVAGPPSPWSLP
jgi:hypothetical protein